MRFENASPRTWLLATTAAWSVLALVLAFLGMGGRIKPLPEDAALVRPLPPLPRTARERLAPLTQYAEIANRPLFADDRRPHPFSLQPQGEEQTKAFDYVLTSVMITPAFKMAIIQAPDNSSPPLRIKLGEADESLPNWTLQSLDARSAVFMGPEGERRLELRVYNGVGGEPPTQVTRTDVAQPQGRPVPVPAGQTARNNDASLPDPPVATPPANVSTPSPVRAQAPPPPTRAEPNQPMTEQAQMEAIRKRIEARRAQLRQEALQQQQQKPPVK